MAKDPAFLFYYQDFLVGTTFMTFEEKGAYITLLCFLADKETITKENILKIIPPTIWDSICCKFSCENGFYFNKRLSNEIKKRREYTESRRKNLHKTEHMSVHMETHMENENEDVNESINSSFNKEVINIKKDEEKKSELLASLKTILEKTKAKYPNPRDQQQILVFVQANIRNKNHNAILHCIEALIKSKEIVNAIPQFLEAVLKIENGKHNAAESEEESNRHKREAIPESVGKILTGIGKSIPAVG